MQSAGLGRFQPVIAESSAGERQPSQTTAELINLHAIAEQVREVADQIDPDNDDQDDGDKPPYLHGDFNANLAEHIEPMALARLANEILQGIEADLGSRKEWDKIAEKAIEFLGLIYEEAGSQITPTGSISKVWHTLMLESAIMFWANAQAEFLPADGPVKVRDDKTAPSGRGIGDGGPPLDDDITAGIVPPAAANPAQQPKMRDVIAEDFEVDFNHYLTTTDRQYYGDFSRMLFSLGPIGTQFRKVYYNPLRQMAVSEWVKAQNLIVSNDAVHLATAGRVTERIMMRHADVKRLQFMKWWLRQPLSMPVDSPTSLDQVIGQIEGIRPGPELPADHRHTIYECYTDVDLYGFEHTDEDGEMTGLPLPYRVTLDRDSRRILEIRRNWKEGDDLLKSRPRYVMFGLIPGLGFYFLGFAHILGNTERALTALEREIIDAGMFSVFPGFVHAKGTFRGDTTQIRPPPGGSVEANIGLKGDIRNTLMPIPYKDLPQSIMALFQKIEDNGRKLSQAPELPVGEGTANIPVGTMIAMIEEGTKVMAGVHKGLHHARSEELELLRDLFAEDPELLTKYNKSPQRVWQTAEEFADMDLVPASDPNTPSHVHRVMRAVALGQVAQMFPDRVNRDAILEEILAVIRTPNPERFILPPSPAQPQQPSPQAIAAQAKIATTQIQAQSKAQGDAVHSQIAAADRQSKERVAAMGEQTERMKDAAEEQGDIAKLHDSAAERADDAQMQREGQQHETDLERQKALWPTAPAPQRAF